MAFNINDMRARLALGGARPAFFQVAITNPVDQSGDLIAPFMIKTASLPESTLGVVKVPYFGREINLPGTRKFSEWNVQIINDEDYPVRDALETWSNAINSLEGNLNTLGASPLLYKSQATVTHFSKTGAPLRVYQFNGIWPSSIGAVDLSWDNGDSIMEFSCTFQYDSYYVVGGSTGNGGGF